MHLCMRTTLIIDDTIMARLKQEAAKQGKTISELVESALRLLLDAKPQKRKALEPLPSFDGGGTLADIADREALYRAMEGR
jgi:hypothetical protein